MPVEVLSAREVPLGGIRAMTVRRSLPQRARTTIGAWCFIDHYGPDDVGATGGMDVAPHPHTGLQTVTWLFAGEVEHRDSGGVHGMVRPGEVNLMTAGAGICHSEVSTPDTTTLHGVQLWVALPEDHRDDARGFQHFAAPEQRISGGTLRVFIGELAGRVSPIVTATPLLGAELMLDPHATVTLDVDPTFEHGVMVDGESVLLDGEKVPHGATGVTSAGPDRLVVENPHDEPTRVVLLGGPPFGESIVMWWNFVGRSHDEVAAFRDQWQAHGDRFGAVDGYTGPTDRIPAPPLPNARLRTRANPQDPA